MLSYVISCVVNVKNRKVKVLEYLYWYCQSIYNNLIVKMRDLRGVAYEDGRAGTSNPAAERRDGLYLVTACVRDSGWNRCYVDMLADRVQMS